jgi:hypothetical protein
MPIFNVLPHGVLPGTQHPMHPSLVLRSAGLLLAIEIALPDALAANLASRSLPLPTNQTGTALIDTGASISGIHEPVAQALGLQPTGAMTFGSAGGSHQHNCYQIKVFFPGSPLPTVELNAVGVNLAGMNKIFLLGMDLLSQCLLVYNGPMGSFTLAY